MNTLMTELAGSTLFTVTGLVVKGTVLLLLAGAIALVLGRRAPAARHLVWTLAMAMLVVLPLAAFALPGWDVPVIVERALPAPTEAAIVAPAGELVTHADGGAGDVATQTLGVAGDVGKQAAVPLWRRALSPSALLWVWVVGAAAVLMWLLAGRVALRGVLRTAEPLTGWESARRDAAWLLEVDRPVRLYRSARAAMPLTWGVLHPVVLVPAEAEAWPEEQQRAVLLHELSHVARFDCLTQLVAGVACALWWFHPGVWYAAHRMRVEREHACDQMVLAAGTPAPEYAAQLLDLALRFRAVRAAPMVALHMARGNQLEGRLLRVLAGVSERRRPSRWTVGLAAAAVLLVTLPLSALQPAVASAPAAPVGQAHDAAPAEHEPDLDGVEEHAVLPDAADAREPDAGTQQAALPAPTPLPVAQSQAAPGTGITMSGDGDSIARIVRRVPLREAAFSILTRDGRTALLLRDTTIVLQLTDRGLEAISVDEKPGDEEAGFLKQVMEGMLRGGLRMLLDRGIEYSLTDLRDARVEGGRLVLESRRGGVIFDEVNINDGNVLEQFSERDARAFAQRVNRARARLP